MKRQKISRAMDHLDEELIAGAMQNDTAKAQRSGEKNMKKTSMWKKWVAVAAVFAIMLSAVIVSAQFIGGGNSFIALDVNPSLEIEVDKNEKVKKISALNEDAVTVLGTMNLTGADLEVAVNAIIGSMLRNNYLTVDQNSILISVDSKNQDTAAKLGERVSKSVSEALKAKDIDASVLTQSYDNGGKRGENGVSGAKAAFIEKIIAAGLKNAASEAYTYEMLSPLSVNELKLILESKDIRPDGVEFSGAASEGKYQGHEEALRIALEAAGVARADASRIQVELDYEDGIRKMLYEIEFVYGDYEYDYEIDAESGAVVKSEKERKELFDDDYEENATAPEGCITRDEAIAIALQHAGITAADARELECEFESGIFGKKRYEIDFKSGNIEYEYTLNAKTGEILKAEKEYDD